MHNRLPMKIYPPVNLLKSLKKELIYGAHIAALVSSALVLTIQLMMDLPVNYIHLIIAYLITIIVYSFNYNKEINNDYITNPDKALFIEQRKKYYRATMVIYGVSLILLVSLVFDLAFALFVMILLAGGILYTVIFKVLTKILPCFKNIYTILIWAYGVTFYIFYYYDLPLDILVALIFFLIYIKMFINAAFFDIKDMSSDSKNNLKTLPILIGRDNTIKLLTILNFAHVLLILYGIYIQKFPVVAASLILFFFYTEFYLIKGKNADNKKILDYSYLIADAEFLLWPLMIIIGKIAYSYLSNSW